jgi:hypothetical protein
MNLSEWRGSIAQALDATTDPATVNPPCAVVGPVADLTRVSGCAWDAQLSVWLVSPAPAGAVSLEWLEQNLPATLAALDGITAVEFDTYTHPVGTLPAYRIDLAHTLDLEV